MEVVDVLLPCRIGVDNIKIIFPFYIKSCTYLRGICRLLKSCNIVFVSNIKSGIPAVDLFCPSAVHARNCTFFIENIWALTNRADIIYCCVKYVDCAFRTIVYKFSIIPKKTSKALLQLLEKVIYCDIICLIGTQPCLNVRIDIADTPGVIQLFGEDDIKDTPFRVVRRRGVVKLPWSELTRDL